MKAAVLLVLFITLYLTGCSTNDPQLHSHIHEITVVPKFEKDGDFTDLIIDDGKMPISIYWSWDPKDDAPTNYPEFPVTLASDTQYTFFVEEQEYSRLKELGMKAPYFIDPKAFMRTNHTLVRISLNDSILFDREVCEIHHRKMQRIDARIIYGLIASRQPYPTLGEVNSQFPHYQEVSFGGCVVGAKKTELMFVCPDCKAAHKKWEKEHPSIAK